MTTRLYELKGDLEIIHQQMVDKVRKIDHLSQTLDNMKHNLWKLKMEFEAKDRELAMIDGRHQVITKVTFKEKTKPMIKMTREQIEAIAKELGVEIKF